jgi:mannose-6-phosphate isomerase-like protein (cupin superfamily)
MGADIQHLRTDDLLHEYGLATQRLLPWTVLNSPFEASWAISQPHSASELHSHHEHEIFVAVRGSAVIESDGDRTPFTAGDVAYFTPGSRHHLLNDSDQEFVFYSVWWDEEMAEKFLARNRAEGVEARFAAEVDA